MMIICMSDVMAITRPFYARWCDLTGRLRYKLLRDLKPEVLCKLPRSRIKYEARSRQSLQSSFSATGEVDQAGRCH
jgi:hypothetical protein